LSSPRRCRTGANGEVVGGGIARGSLGITASCGNASTATSTMMTVVQWMTEAIQEQLMKLTSKFERIW